VAARKGLNVADGSTCFGRAIRTPSARDLVVTRTPSALLELRWAVSERVWDAVYACCCRAGRWASHFRRGTAPHVSRVLAEEGPPSSHRPVRPFSTTPPTAPQGPWWASRRRNRSRGDLAVFFGLPTRSPRPGDPHVARAGMVPALCRPRITSTLGRAPTEPNSSRRPTPRRRITSSLGRFRAGRRGPGAVARPSISNRVTDATTPESTGVTVLPVSGCPGRGSTSGCPVPMEELVQSDPGPLFLAPSPPGEKGRG